MAFPTAAIPLVAVVFSFCFASAAAFYPAYKFEIDKKADDSILVPPPLQSAAARQIFSPYTRGAFINPLFGYRFHSSEPSNNNNQQQQQPTSSEEEEDLGENLTAESAGPSSNYDPLYFESPDKKNFYTHIWRDIVQRMPAYRGNGRRLFRPVQRQHEPLLEKRDAVGRMHAIRMG